MTQRACFASPVGPLTLSEAGGCLTRLDWGGDPGPAPSPLLHAAGLQLAAYFAGELTRFDLPLDQGTGFAGQVRRAMAAIPYGETRRYGDLAGDLDASAQAVGQACGANPLPVLIPCHRVLGARGLGGYSGRGGVDTKVALLRLERAAGLLI